MKDDSIKSGDVQIYSPSADLEPATFDSDRLSSVTAPVDDANENYQPLTDGFARRLTYLRLSITDFCNFRCEYCLPNGYQGKRPDDELSLSEIAALIRGFAQVGTKKSESPAVSRPYVVTSSRLFARSNRQRVLKPLL